MLYNSIIMTIYAIMALSFVYIFCFVNKSSSSFMLNYYLKKNTFCWKSVTRKFDYVSTHNVETVKKLDCNLYGQLTRWARGNAPDCDVRGPRFGPQLWQGYICLPCFICCCGFTFLSKPLILWTFYFSLQYNNSFRIPKILHLFSVA